MSQKLGDISPNQCEVTYVNHIALAGEVNLHGKLSEVFQVWRNAAGLAAPEDCRFAARFILEAEGGVPVGRLIVEAEPGHIDDTPIVALTLTARGRPEQATLSEVPRFFDLGRDKIVQTFAFLTTKKMHGLWGRTA